MLLAELGSNEHAAKATVAALGQSFALKGLSYRNTASIGVTLLADPLAPIDGLVKQAHLAMYRAKEEGRYIVRFFDPGMEAAVMKRAALEADSRQALLEQQLSLHYQPQVLGDGRPAGAEVLVRWRHPQRGMVSPVDFIPLAEETGLILPLGHWVLETTCAQLAHWAGQPARPI